jgi:hypothetical protein
MWYIDVGANAESMYVTLTCGSSDFDTYGRFGAEPTTSTYDWRGYTAGGEENTVSSPAQGRHYIMVQYYSGDDDYVLTATITYGAPADTTAPTVSISAPANGATVDGTVTISFSASDANGISSRAIKIDGTTVSTSSSYSWDTTGYSNGQHTIRCEATDPSSNTGYDQHTVTVDNQVSTGDMNTGGDAYNSYGASDSATTLSTPISGTGEVTHSADQYDQFKVAVSSGDQASFDFTAPSGATALDVVIYDTDKSAFFTRSNINSISETVTASGNGYIYFTVDTDATADSGTYSLSISVSGAPVDTTAPTVSITNPSNGATVSGTVTISFSASDANGIAFRAIKIEGSTVSTSSSYSWKTAAYSDGIHTICCEATDPSSNTGYQQISVTVSNGGSSDDGGLLTDGVSASGHMSEADGADMFWIDVGASALSMRVLLTQSSGDFDTYGRFGAEPTVSTYDWRGYTSGGEDNTVSSPAEGRHYIMVDWYSGDADYTLTVTITYGGSTGWGTGGKYAIIVGISDYLSISDLSYCDEDATDWYNFLNGQGYECHIYGDGHTSNYPVYHGDAYEATVRAAIQELANHAQSGDTVLFVTSGHGAGDGNGNSYLCMYDCSGSAGCYYDYELASDIGGFNTGVNIMVFIDHCYSGGMGPELMALSHNIYCTTTCTEDGYGYDDPTHNNGAWTYEYLERYWVGSPTSSAESIYDSASATYPHSGGDACMEFDGFPGSFYI